MTDVMGQLTGWVPFPNVLLDRVMPKLTDTEWRILCVIVRQTLGWKIQGSRKQYDRISQSQLKRKTGRESAAISRAINSLVQMDMIVVLDDNGRTLRFAAERRRSRSHLWFGLGTALTSQIYK